MSDLIDREEAIKAVYDKDIGMLTQWDIGRNAGIDYAIKQLEKLPPAQPEEAIPVAWIESRIERFMTMDNAFGGLTANIMLVMLNEWKREQEGETE